MRTPNKVAFACAMVALPAAALLHVARVHHASVVTSHYFEGRAGNCTLRESFDGESLSRLQAANVAEIKASIKVLRQDGPYSLWSTPTGEYWIPTASKDAIAYDLAEQKRNIYGNRIRPGDVVLDAGANIGVFTRKALSFGAGRVIAIEPGPENLECLRRNFAAEIAEGRVVLYSKGIWDKDDILKFAVDPTDSAKDSFVRPINDAKFLEIPVTTVDAMVQDLHLDRVDFIKMDIEGAEQKAVTGAKNTIARFRPRMALCIYHVKGDEIGVPQKVLAANATYKVAKTCFCALDRIVPEVAFFY